MTPVKVAKLNFTPEIIAKRFFMVLYNHNFVSICKHARDLVDWKKEIWKEQYYSMAKLRCGQWYTHERVFKSL